MRPYLLPIIQECIDRNGVEVYIEPFVGGANMIDHIRCRKRIGSDINSELIELLSYMRDNPDLAIFPDECSREHYAEVREARKKRTGAYSIPYTAGIGYFASYGGRYFDGGYGRNSKERGSVYAERLRHAKIQSHLLKDIKFDAVPYDHYMSGEYRHCVFYLDPPYRGTKTYAGKHEFDYEKFYAFCRKMARDNFVFISEYDMPEDFKVLWEKERKVFQKSNRNKADFATERLFTFDSQKTYS